MVALTGDGTQTDESYLFASGTWQRFSSSVAGFQNNYYFMGGATIGSTFALVGGQSGTEGGPFSMGLVLPAQPGQNPARPTALMQIPNGGVYSMGVAALGSNLYIAGGRSATGVVGDVGVFPQSVLAVPDPTLTAPASGSAGIPLKFARAGLGLAAANGKLYAMGGYTLDATGPNGVRADNTVQSLDPNATGWLATGDVGGPTKPATKRYGFGIATIGTKIYLVGGVDDTGKTLRSVDIYDAVTNAWTQGAPMPTPRSMLALVAHNGLLFAIGGADANGRALRTVEVYVP